MTRVAKVRGTMIVPGVSKNMRLYTPEILRKAHDHMQEALSSDKGLPLTMATSHAAAAGDDARDTVGRLTSVSIDPSGKISFEADIADTTAGRDIAALVVGDRPYIKGVSIRGNFLGEMKTVTMDDGQSVTTADDLEIKGLDFTARPGVEGAQVECAELAENTEPHAVFESVHEAEFVDAVDEATDVTYADPGWRADQKKRYPLNTAKRVRAAWSHINVAENASKYTAPQTQRIKSKVKKAAKKFDIDVQQESEAFAAELSEVMEAYASMCLDNGPGEIRVAGYASDPSDLAALAGRLAAAALAALNQLDPDNDGDIDGVDQDESGDTDDDMEDVGCPQCAADLPEQAMYCPMCSLPVPQAESTAPTTEEAPVADETPTAAPAVAETPAAETAPEAAPVAAAAPAFDPTAMAAMIAQAVAAALKPVEAAPAAPVVEAAPEATAAAPVATFTAEQVAEQVKAAQDATIAEAVEMYRKGVIPATRKGLVDGAAGAAASGTHESAALAGLSKSQLTEAAADAYRSDPFFGALMSGQRPAEGAAQAHAAHRR